MKWRLKEGEGVAIYAIGVEDNGVISGLLKEELESSLATLREMADRLDIFISILNLVNYTICILLFLFLLCFGLYC